MSLDCIFYFFLVCAIVEFFVINRGSHNRYFWRFYLSNGFGENHSNVD